MLRIHARIFWEKSSLKQRVGWNDVQILIDFEVSEIYTQLFNAWRLDTNPLESRTLAMKHPTLKVPPERCPLHGYSVCAVTQIMRKKHKQIGLTYADWYDRLDWNCFCWCLMKHAGLDTLCHYLYTSSTQNNDYLQKKESLPHHFQLFFFRWIRRDCRYVPCRSLELQKAGQLGFIIHFVHESQHVILMESLFAFTIFFLQFHRGFFERFFFRKFCHA